MRENRTRGEFSLADLTRKLKAIQSRVEGGSTPAEQEAARNVRAQLLDATERRLGREIRQGLERVIGINRTCNLHPRVTVNGQGGHRVVDAYASTQDAGSAPGWKFNIKA
jgi:hypothetical protein